MDTNKLAAEIRKIGREVNPDNLARTRELYIPLHTVAPFEGVDIQRDILYAEDERNRLDMFTAADKKDQLLPVLIYVHGGGFIAGDKYTPGTPFYDNIGVWAVKNGLVEINITHRLAPQHKWPAVIEDIASTVQWITNHGESYGIDTSQMYLMGQSAGAAHVASYIAHPEIYVPAEHGLKGIILMSPIVNLLTLEPDDLIKAYYGDDASLYAERSSLAGLKQADIPVMLVIPEHEVDFFEKQAIETLKVLKERDNKLPRFVHLIGHNHLSGILHIGLEGDQLGPQILNFINAGV